MNRLFAAFCCTLFITQLTENVEGKLRKKNPATNGWQDLPDSKIVFAFNDATSRHGIANHAPSIQVCSRNDRNLADCIIRSVKYLQPSLVHGNLGPGFQLPPVEPFALNTINIGRGNDFKATFTNLIIRGASKFRIEKMRANINDLKFDFIINFANLDIRGKYDLVFRLFGFGLKGRGDIIGNFQNARARVTMRGRKYQRNGQTYLQFEKFYIKIQPVNLKNLQLTNLFQGNQALEEIGNAFINGNSDFFLNDVYPGIESNLSDLFTGIANRIVSEATFDELFPNF